MATDPFPLTIVVNHGTKATHARYPQSGEGKDKESKRTVRRQRGKEAKR